MIMHGCPGHYSLHIEYYDDPVTLQDSNEFSPFQVLCR